MSRAKAARPDCLCRDQGKSGLTRQVLGNSICLLRLGCWPDRVIPATAKRLTPVDSSSVGRPLASLYRERYAYSSRAVGKR